MEACCDICIDVTNELIDGQVTRICSRTGLHWSLLCSDFVLVRACKTCSCYGVYAHPNRPYSDGLCSACDIEGSPSERFEFQSFRAGEHYKTGCDSYNEILIIFEALLI
jgi:hypothetical protein